MQNEKNVVLALLGLTAVVAILGVVFLIVPELNAPSGNAWSPMYKLRRASFARYDSPPIVKGPLCMRPGEICAESAEQEYGWNMPCCVGRCTKTVVAGLETTEWRCA